ncbi:Asp-tRNA(Asn)/Glu-tRNA(Gln) amidotransferase subunit GatC [Chitinimonas sp. BJB300]|uniref:Asp-tRNA(Asn)/Glu-tRNA(Gln) amidotransferase subunit GatC n=1 Tax=Chitinimonas sp. BJB300 TaxID=1559339 RepID=UPI000C0E2E37|nr:Asp-tRNA(Asn)/Glu-tRNA(Gln) amidotransferase subunit GatC [Chitinimonas sp. BJB300]PHV12643.1 Asp-tRNA(Asn)/Glu-tRNA(Gln) amidotransferase GatCAB subunit C [Chitinimonas sp. BJB300]TSJ91177.1 Asp-tRNA(Asn)/Glu-tRNA(Gln) amidotransferase subunit GatC [Chitinimonas sp. BJB300]
MSLTDADVRRIARLARLRVSDEEVTEVGRQLNGILGLIEQLQAIDTTGVEPMSHARDVALRLRNDVATEPNLRDKFQAIAPAVENGLYLVPKVIE